MAFLNISSKTKKDIIKKLDRSDYFKLSNPGTSRPELYNFALALGYRRGYPTDISDAKESLIREEYVANSRYIYSSLYFAEHVNSGHKDDLDNLIHAEETFALSDKYANTGFDVLNDYYESTPDSVLVYKLIQEMDEIYQSIKEELEKQ